MFLQAGSEHQPLHFLSVSMVFFGELLLKRWTKRDGFPCPWTPASEGVFGGSGKPKTFWEGTQHPPQCTLLVHTSHNGQEQMGHLGSDGHRSPLSATGFSLIISPFVFKSHVSVILAPGNRNNVNFFIYISFACIPSSPPGGPYKNSSSIPPSEN